MNREIIQLPKIKRNPKLIENLCRCRPVCKSRRRVWKGQIQQTSDELLLERKPPAECIRRVPDKVFPNGPCPLLGRKKGITIIERDFIPERPVVRICPAPVDNTVDTTYLGYAELAKKIGAWGAVHANCMFCECGACCPCGKRNYVMHDAERATRRREDMRNFDARVKTDYQNMRIMYDKM